MIKKLRWGVLGMANIAMRSLIPTLLEHEHAQVSGIASRDYNKAKEYAEEISVKAYSSYDDLIGSKEIDIVYIPLPNSMHYEWARKALLAGKHVAVEKSAFMNMKETEEILTLAEELNLGVIEHFQFLHHSQNSYVKDLVDGGKIGNLISMRSSFGFPVFNSSNNIRYLPELGGGALLDAGAYTLRVSSYFLGEDIKLLSAASKMHKTYKVDWYGSAHLVDSSTGVFSQLTFGFDNFYQCNYELWGQEGKITVHRAFTARNDHLPKISLELKSGNEELELPADDHFKNIVTHFTSIILNGQLEKERQNIYQQARLLNAFTESRQIL